MFNYDKTHVFQENRVKPLIDNPAGYQTLNVSKEDALMQHYRKRLGHDVRMKQFGNLQDTTAHAWARSVMEAVFKACSMIFENDQGFCPY